MSALALRWLAGLAIFTAVFAAGYWRGDVARDNAWIAANLKTERAAAKAYQAEVKRADQAVADLGSFARAQTARYTELTGAFNELRRTPRYRLVSPAPVVAVDAGDPAGRPPNTAPQAVAEARSGDGGSDLRLSAGAVWMWNSALAGSDQPSGACGLADPASPACAAQTGITLDDAWDNQAVNAQQCAEDRLNHQNLIDYLKAKP
jgi:hypothetical protein